MQVLSNPHPGNLGLTSSLAAFLLGFIATSSQILLLREFNAHYYGNELTFGLVLASWLLWGGLGSILASRWRFRQEYLARVYYLAILLFALSLAGVRAFRFLLHILPGELTGMMPVLGLSLGLCFLVSFPLGALFVFNVERNQGRISVVYVLESLGATIAGVGVYFFLLPRFSAWQTAALVGGVCALLIFVFLEEKRNILVLALPMLLLAALAILDFPSQKLYWKPYHLIASQDSRYGKLQVVKTEEQVSLYSNNSPVYSYPDPATAEESVHFSLLQNPLARRVLLIGGGAGGTLREILKYPHARLDYVELDPEIIRLSKRFLPEEERKALADSRVSLFFQDGRAFLQKTQESYDCILLSLPDPSTAQLNRFYTREFFLLVEKKLAADGVFSFLVSSAENYIGEELQQFLSSLYHTLADVFPEVEVIPGARNVFLASSRPLTVSPEELGRRVEALNLRTLYITPPFLSSRLHPLRRDQLDDRIKSSTSRVNSDLTPASFYFHIVLWSMHFRGIEATALKFFSRVSPFLLLGFPLALFLIFLVFLASRRKERYFYLAPLAVMGFTTILTEIIVLIWFQALYGYLYGAIAFLLAVFMFGLFSGSWASSKRARASFPRLLVVQAGFLFLLLVLQIAVRTKPPEVLAYFFLFVLGYLGGDLFIVSNRLYLQHKTDYGIGYGLDLIGSFGGALIASALLIPLAGLLALLASIFLLNLFCFLFLLLRPRP